MSGAVLTRPSVLDIAGAALASLLLSTTLHAAEQASAPMGAACDACHGAGGAGNPAIGAPRIAGLSPAYAERQLENFADGKRVNLLMTPTAKSLSAAERAAIAEFYARAMKGGARPMKGAQSVKGGAEAEPPAAAATAPASSLGAQLALRGRWSDELPGCTQCHGTGGVGVGDTFPALAGQPSLYLSSQLHAWQSGSRGPGPNGLMGAIAKKLSDADIQAVADYYSRPPVSSGAPAPAGAEPPSRAAGDALPREPARSSFAPPEESALPAGEFGNMVRMGEKIFENTKQYAPAFVGNDLRCGSCHLDAGRKADSAPLWAAYVAYPEYRAKNKKVNTFEERLQGCFEYSMNGAAPPLGGPVLVALESYAYWLATGAPIGSNLPGRGYPKLPKPAVGADYDRGKAVYRQKCSLCHGDDGAGRRANDGSATFPALWGSESFNWGAGIAGIANAAAFIEANMPLSQARTLEPQAAWDVAAYMDSQERPQDPRYVDSVAATRSKFHDSPDSMYGMKVGGHLLGKGSVKPGGTALRGARQSRPGSS